MSTSETLLTPEEQTELRMRLRAEIASLVVGVVLLVAKFLAFALTGSAAVFSDVGRTSSMSLRHCSPSVGKDGGRTACEGIGFFPAANEQPRWQRISVARG
jgi:hypothetical protein